MRTPRANRIAEQRRAKGLSQQQLAEAVGVHWTTISKLERGITRLDFVWAEKISEALGVDEYDILPPVRRVTSLAISGYIRGGGVVDAFEGEDAKVWSVNSNIFDDINTVWVEVKENALYPYFKDADLIGLTWATDEERRNSDGVIDYSGFHGRFCLVEDEAGDQFMGIVAPSKTLDTVDLHNAHFPPIEGIKPRSLAQATVAIMNNPAMRRSHSEKDA